MCLLQIIKNKAIKDKTMELLNNYRQRVIRLMDQSREIQEQIKSIEKTNPPTTEEAKQQAKALISLTVKHGELTGQIKAYGDMIEELTKTLIL